MKKYAVLGIFCLVLLSIAVAGYTQQGGFTGPQAFGQHQAGFTGQQGFGGQQGFTGQLMRVTVAQVAQTFPDKSKAIIRGTIVQQISNDRYLFRDSSGDILIKIKNDRWWGLSVGPNDQLELGGELKRERNGMIKYFDAKSIRLAR